MRPRPPFPGKTRSKYFVRRPAAVLLHLKRETTMTMPVHTPARERFTFADWAEAFSGIALTAAFGAAFLIVLAQVYSVLAA